MIIDNPIPDVTQEQPDIESIIKYLWESDAGEDYERSLPSEVIYAGRYGTSFLNKELDKSVELLLTTPADKGAYQSAAEDIGLVLEDWQRPLKRIFGSGGCDRFFFIHKPRKLFGRMLPDWFYKTPILDLICGARVAIVEAEGNHNVTVLNKELGSRLVQEYLEITQPCLYH